MAVRDTGKGIGRASGLKMVYASATKGTFSLHAAVLTTAHAMGLTEDYMRELTESQPAMLAAMERMIPRIPLDAARWEGEMHEIAATFAAAGVTPKFHQGAGDMMALADRTPISAETRETVDTDRTLLQALDMMLRRGRRRKTLLNKALAICDPIACSRYRGGVCIQAH